MKVVVNGELREVSEPCTVRDLLDQAGMAERPCAVEINRQLVPRREHEQHALREGDRVEIVTLVGGG